MIKERDVTGIMDWEDYDHDEESLRIIKCSCGETFGNGFLIRSECMSEHSREKGKCPVCGKKFYYYMRLHIIEVTET